MPSRLKAAVARTVSRLPGQCPADATAWAAGVSTRRLPVFPQSPGCRIDALHDGECLCRRLGRGADQLAELIELGEQKEPGLTDLGDGYVQAPRADLEMALGGRCEHDNLAEWCLTCARRPARGRVQACEHHDCNGNCWMATLDTNDPPMNVMDGA